MSKILYWLEVASAISAAASQLLPSPSPSESPVPLPPYSPPEETNTTLIAGIAGGVIGGIAIAMCVCKYFCPSFLADCQEEVARSQARDAAVKRSNPVKEWHTREEIVHVEITGATKHPGEIDTWKFNSEHGNH